MDKNDYLNLVPSDGSGKLKFMSFLDAILDHAIALGSTNESIGEAFDLSNAAGNQLDIIGDMVGVSRLLSYVPENGTREMDDDEYRLAIQLKIARNEWDGTNGGAIDIYSDIFGEDISVTYEDNQDMSVNVIIDGFFTTREAEILNATGTLLVPAGITKTITTNGGTVDGYEIFTAAPVTGMEIFDKVTML